MPVGSTAVSGGYVRVDRPCIVERWIELSTQDLRAQVQQLVAARLPADHAVWRAVRRYPTLAARMRGVLSGLAASAAGSKDEAMQKVWISAARAALDKPEEQKPARPAPAPVVAEEPAEELSIQLPKPPPVTRAPRAVIPAMVFQEPR